MSDVHSLKQAPRAVDGDAQELVAKNGDRNLGKEEEDRLVSAAEDRGIRFTYTSKGLAQHKRNTTVTRTVPPYRTAECDVKGPKLIFWHLDVYFADPSGSYSGSQLIKLENVAEDTVIESIVRKALQKLCKRNKRARSSSSVSVPEHNKVYDQAEVSDLDVYLEKQFAPLSSIPIPAKEGLDSHRFDPIDTSRSLLSILKGRAVIEYPIIRIAPKKSFGSRVLTHERFGHSELAEALGENYSSHDSDSGTEESVLANVSEKPPAQSNEVRPSASESRRSTTAAGNQAIDRELTLDGDRRRADRIRHTDRGLQRATQPQTSCEDTTDSEAVSTSNLKDCSAGILKIAKDDLFSTEKADDPGLALHRKLDQGQSMGSSKQNLRSTANLCDDSHGSSERKGTAAVKRGRSSERRSRSSSVPHIRHGDVPEPPVSILDSARQRPLSSRSIVESSTDQNDERPSKKRRKVESGNRKESSASGTDSEADPAHSDASTPEGR